MRYRVLVQAPARRQLEEITRRIAADSPAHAAAWLARMLESVGSLSRFPLRSPEAPEAHLRGRCVRVHVVGDYLVRFTVLGREVRILNVRHGARQPPRA